MIAMFIKLYILVMFTNILLGYTPQLRTLQMHNAISYNSRRELYIVT